MRPTRRGQVVKFLTPYEDEDPDQLYVVLEYIEDGNQSRAKIQASNPGSAIKYVSTVLVDDLVVDEAQTMQLDYYLKYGDHNLF